MVVLHHCGVVVAGSYSRSALQCDMLCTHVGKRYVDVREGRRPQTRGLCPGVQTILAAQRLPEAAYDWVVEATGSWAGLRQAIPMTLPAALYS